MGCKEQKQEKKYAGYFIQKNTHLYLFDRNAEFYVFFRKYICLSKKIVRFKLFKTESFYKINENKNYNRQEVFIF